MKIRSDFVTNSSSVSYIITAKEDILKLWSHVLSNTPYSSFYTRILDEFKKKGEKFKLNDEELYSMGLTFLTDDLRCEIPEELWDTPEMTSFSDFLRTKDIDSMNDDEFYCYLYFAILNPNLIPHIGTTQIEHY